MKRILLLLIALLIVCFSINARTFVLIAGVSNYGDQKMNLTQTTKDAKEFKKVMETQTKDITILTSSYANKNNILEKLSAICNRAGKGDRIIFYFSGHGTSGRIVAQDGFIKYDEIVELLNRSEAKEKICFIDACQSGSASTSTQNTGGGSSLSSTTNGRKDLAFMVGCRGDEFSIEANFVGAGYFTQALVKGLRGKSDTNGDKKITLKELFKYVFNDVVTRSDKNQHPQLIAPANMFDSVIATWE